MKNNHFFTVYYLFLAFWNTQSYSETYSVLLFFLEENQLTIERYSPKELNHETKELSASFRHGHTLYSIDMSDIISSQSQISLKPENLHILEIKNQTKNTYQYELIWPSLISKKPENLPEKMSNITFDIKTNTQGTCEISGHLDALGFPLYYKFTIDKPIISGCAVFLNNTFFNYDKGIFSRKLSISQRDEYKILYQCKKRSKTKKCKSPVLTSVITKSLLLPVY